MEGGPDRSKVSQFFRGSLLDGTPVRTLYRHMQPVQKLEQNSNKASTAVDSVLDEPFFSR